MVSICLMFSSIHMHLHCYISANLKGQDLMISQVSCEKSGKRTPIYEDGPLTVRYLTNNQDDAEFAAKMRVHAFRKKYEHATSSGSIEDCIQAAVSEYIGQEDWFYERHLVAELNGEPTGIIVATYHADPNPIYEDADYEQFGCTDICGLICLARSNRVLVPADQSYIHHICVDEHFQGKGIGKKLLKVAEEEAKQQGCKEIFLWVSSDNKAKQFFKRQGYITVETSSKCCFIWCSTGRVRLQKMVKRLDFEAG